MKTNSPIRILWLLSLFLFGIQTHATENYDSNSIIANTNDGNNYCSANGGATTDEHIGRVQLGTIDNVSTTNSSGYSDFTNISTNLTKGLTNTITLTSVMTSTTQYPEQFKVWIDYNQDNDFEDQGELVVDQNVTGDATTSKDFTVPQNAANGSTRMRVRMNGLDTGGVNSPCGSGVFGEVEDYTIIIVGSGEEDTQAPSTPTGLTASNITDTSVLLSWNAATDNVGVTGYDILRNNIVISTVTATSSSITGLTANTTYQFNVRAKDAAGNVSVAGNVISVTTTDGTTPTPTYCTANSNNASEEFISRLQLGSIDKTSTSESNGYSDFTSESTNLSRGSSNTITITPTWTGSVFSEAYSVWIDYNQDGDFEDASEQVWTQTATRNTSVSGTFTIPVNANTGITRMRVIMRFNTIPSSCGSFNFGEVEDYSVSITDSKSSITTHKVATVRLYPNPVTKTLTIALKDSKKISYEIVDMLGKIVSKGKTASSINVTNLRKGVYSIKISEGSNTHYKRFIKN